MSKTLEQSDLREGYKSVKLGPREIPIPGEWEAVPFDEAIELNPRYDKPENGPFDYLPMDAVDEEKQTIEYWTQREKDDCTTTWFKNGDTVYAKITPCTENGKIALIEGLDTEVGSGSTEFLVFHPREGVTDERFVYYLSNLPEFRAVTISLMEGSTGRQRVPSDVFKGGLRIPLPPLPEQRRIADILSTVDEQIHQTDQIIEETERLRFGLMSEFFHTGYYEHSLTERPTFGQTPSDWKIVELADVADVEMGSSPKSKYYNEDGDGLPFYQANNEFGYRNPTHDRWCSKPNKTADEGDTLVTIRGTYVGQVNVASERCCIGRGLAAVSAQEVDQEYLYHHLAHRERYVKSIASGSTFDSINSSELETLSVLVPPREEQEKIASCLRKMQQKYLKEQECKQQYKELKRGLMQDLLTGKVRVNTD
ncbi:restriction endonuclease subunit S [Haloferax volcanii]|uniref:Restriction endonuclease subunit S n=1 Tax=Haloferax volcanii TaxID=2246 RepID=A0A6C0UWX4_HALVO|nr:restriction endonuclease subunit S [Haloferax alexandrinus]QIB79063.1 restriction endonuclease subunit S [Haloferax alexandrinus]